MNVAVTVLITVLMFGVLIFIHEFGHFVTAKLCGVKVNEFSLGMGPKLFGFKKGETQYNVRALPIGGFVAMEGEEEDSEDPRAFKKQKIWKRIVICSAGVFMNFLLGLIITVSLVATANTDTLASTVVQGLNTSDTSIVSLEKGDKIVSISGYRIYTGNDITFGISRSDPTGKKELIELETDFVVIRDGKRVQLKNVHPFARVKLKDGSEQDVYSFYVKGENKNVLNVLKHGVSETFSYVRTTVLGLLDLVTGRVGIDALGGVIKVGEVVGEVRQYGLSQFLSLVAMISVNLGVMNLLPIPALDGGRIMLFVFEAIFRKPLNSKVEYVLIAASMILLYALMIFVAFNDIISIL